MNVDVAEAVGVLIPLCAASAWVGFRFGRDLNSADRMDGGSDLGGPGGFERRSPRPGRRPDRSGREIADAAQGHKAVTSEQRSGRSEGRGDNIGLGERLEPWRPESPCTEGPPAAGAAIVGFKSTAPPEPASVTPAPGPRAVS